MKVFIIVFSGIVILFLIMGLLELKLLTVTEYEIASGDTPESLHGKRIAVVSDLHGVYHGKENARLIEKLKKINAEYIVVPGDVINGRSEKELKYAEHILKSLSSISGQIIYTFGNHEEKLAINMQDRVAYEKLINISNEYAVLLNDEAFCPKQDEDLCFVGLNLPLWLYHDHDRTGMLKTKIRDIIEKKAAAGKYTILIAHDPEHFDNYAESGANLCICGHLHGGIVRLPFLGGMVTPRLQIFTKRSKGIFEKGSMKMVISGGVGWHDFPIRIFNRPEIVVIKFL